MPARLSSGRAPALGRQAMPAAILLASIDAGGWSAQYAGAAPPYAITPPSFAPDAAPRLLPLIRQGFDAQGNPAILRETLTITQRVRQPYPNHASPTVGTVALSDYVYASDIAPGVANNSTVASPPPIANWIMPHRLTVGNSVRLELIAFHRNARAGQQVACVKFTASDGTATVSRIISATIVSGRAGDQNAVVCHVCDLDISALADNRLITVNAEIYPWIGTAAAILRSADGTTARGFSPRYFLKNTVKAANPPLALVTSGGNDGTGVWSTSYAAAAASPFATVQAAINAIAAQSGVTGGVVDGCRLLIGAGSFPLIGATTTRSQNAGALVITRDPNVARASAIVSFGAGSWRPRLGGALTAPLTTGAVLIDDLTVQRTGTLAVMGEAATRLEVMWSNLAFDNGGNNASWLANADDYLFGVSFTNLPGGASAFGPTANEHRCLRGVSADMNFGGFYGWLMVGSSIARPGAALFTGTTISGMIAAYNQFRNPIATSAVYDLGITGAGAETISGAAIVQNLFEITHTTASTPGLRISSDTPVANNTANILIHANTITGFFAVGRCNLLYDNSSDVSVHRAHTLHSFRGNIHSQINTKGDIFDADGSYLGNQPYTYGVGCAGEFSQWIDANSGGLNSSFAQAFPGLNARIGASATVRNDPLFANYQGTANSGATPVAGAGGGSYGLQPGSPARGIVASALLSHDLAGTARPAACDAAGAYA